MNNNTDLFKLMVQKQSEWKKQYYENQKAKRLIRIICNRRYESKSHQTLEQIHQELERLGFLEEVILIEEKGNKYYEPI